MRLRRFWSSDSGSAALEFIILGLLLQALVLGFGLSAQQQQRTQMGAQIAARQAVRLIALNPGSPNPLGQLEPDIEGMLNLADGQLRLEATPQNPVPGDIVRVRASIGASNATASMRVPR